uniref:Uncharacterized protein n=1 Tax=Cajanus cajan TaxID=3821 RepID=A0A151QRW2_CAJCA|nr:hypothetical protein KK1_046147 [Cajanus cajan]KYP33042.1 hypothetical protein KK1_046151 [Cajanus cajan]KYP33043.1 hypothetical protein KK1_046152 [Cajanus cajan]
MDVDAAIGDDAKKVQHVTKKSSDELLRKFAEVGGSSNAPKRKKKRDSGGGGSAAFVERRWLLPAERKTALLQRVGIGRAHVTRTRDFRNKLLLGTLEKVRIQIFY